MKAGKVNELPSFVASLNLVKQPAMDFSYSPLNIRSESLIMDYFLVPWDARILGYPVAEINHLEVIDARGAGDQFSIFVNWCDTQKIQFCNCRIRHDQLSESFFLQQHNFRFVELNYSPELRVLDQLKLPGNSIVIEPAKAEDQELLAQMAGRIFKHGRFHQDPALGSEVGNERYKIWLLNSFSYPGQSIYKCMDNDVIVGFFVVEYPGESRCHWSLIGLAPGLGGRGIGARVWQAMMRFHQDEGMKSIVTSISSHNTAVFNLFVKLGFRFPLPKVTFHWRP